MKSHYTLCLPILKRSLKIWEDIIYLGILLQTIDQWLRTAVPETGFMEDNFSMDQGQRE